MTSEAAVPDGETDEDEQAPVGSASYRAYVGPASQYDVMGATQFALLYALGLRQGHRLLDIGCGSLRAGRLFISYLEPGGYTGIEPNGWLIDEAIERQLGQAIIDIKRPQFRLTDSFDVSGLGSFDFVVAQSVASHTGPSLVRPLLHSVKAALAADGLAAITFMNAKPDNPNVVHVGPDDDVAPWLYPRCYSYRRESVERFAAGAGLAAIPIPWFHPRQTWWLLGHSRSALPPDEFVRCLTGASRADGFERSWWTPPLPRRLYETLPSSWRDRVRQARRAARR